MKNIKKYTLILALGLGLIGCNEQSSERYQSSDSPADVVVKRVAITSIVEHAALDLVHKGVADELKDSGFEEGKNLIIDFQNAQGSMATAGQIAKKFVGDKPDVIVAIATPSAQSVAAATKTIPIVFSAVTDPVEAKLVPSWEASNTNVTGASDKLPLDKQIELMLELIPDLKSVGYVYSPSEVNSTIILKNLKQLLAEKDIQVIEAPAQKTTDVTTAMRSLIGKVDLVFSSTDNNVISTYEAMYKIAIENKIPLMASDPEITYRGAAAAMGANYYDLGRQTGEIVVRILNGENPGDIKTSQLNKFTLMLNKNAAELQGLTISKELLEKADKVLE